MKRSALSHEQARMLLPWLANGTLAGEELEGVERHVRECLPCRAELREHAELRELIRRHPDVPVALEQNFERLRRRIEAAGARPLAREGGASDEGKKRTAHRRSRHALLAVAASVAFAAVATLLVSLPGSDPSSLDAARYGTLSDAAEADSLIDVVFAQGATHEQIRTLIAEAGGTVVDGPSELGRYRVRVAASDAPTGADRELLIQRLRAEPLVRFAAPAFSAGPTSADAGEEEAPGRNERSPQ